MTQQKIFQSTQSDKIESGIEIFLQRWKAGWLMFLCTVFLGGGGPLIFIKAIFINTFSIIASSLFARLKEEQTEDLILWELGPLTVFILLLTLAVTGGW
jgi:NADH:ubiquinone oxidoreductase subunit H